MLLNRSMFLALALLLLLAKPASARVCAGAQNVTVASYPVRWMVNLTNGNSYAEALGTFPNGDNARTISGW